MFDRVVAKDKILKQCGAPTAIKKLFQEQIEQIRCSHELTEEKLNLKSSVAVPKILIIQIFQKTEKFDIRVFEAIDKAFGVPIIFEIIRQGQCSYCACYRRRNDSDRSKWVFSDYFISDWTAIDFKQVALPVALSMDSLYEQLVRRLLPISSGEQLSELIVRITEIRKREREADKLSYQIKKEKQFNRRVALNRSLNDLKQDLQNLKQ